MNRRSFLTKMFATAVVAAVAPTSLVYATPKAYTGELLLNLQANGGWDVTSYCDPKENIAGEKKINYWANNDKIQRVGEINYAPFANNDWFFQKYYKHMLIINGVDAQTNSHETGVLHNVTGRNAVGAPNLTALFAAAKAPNAPMSYMSMGGYNDAAGLVSLTRIQGTAQLFQLANPDFNHGGYRTSSSLERIRALRLKRLERGLSRTDLMGRERATMEAHKKALEGQALLRTVSDLNVDPHNNSSDVDAALYAFKTGIACAADAQLPGDLDTHGDHDNRHRNGLTELNERVDRIWTKAEELGIAHRLTVVLTSDFGRTPHYNDTEGKDHWPIGSTIVMRKNASWANRTVGATDGGHNALRVNPNSLERDDNNGTIIYPKHVHKALQRQLGIESFAQSVGYGINAENFNFFG